MKTGKDQNNIDVLVFSFVWKIIFDYKNVLVVECDVLGASVVDTATFTVNTDVVGVANACPSVYVTGFDGSVLEFDLRLVESVFGSEDIFVAAASEGCQERARCYGDS